MSLSTISPPHTKPALEHLHDIPVWSPCFWSRTLCSCQRVEFSLLVLSLSRNGRKRSLILFWGRSTFFLQSAVWVLPGWFPAQLWMDVHSEVIVQGKQWEKAWFSIYTLVHSIAVFVDQGETFKHKDSPFQITQLGLCGRQVPATTTQLQRKERSLKELPQTFLQNFIFISIDTN